MRVKVLARETSRECRRRRVSISNFAAPGAFEEMHPCRDLRYKSLFPTLLQVENFMRRACLLLSLLALAAIPSCQTTPNSTAAFDQRWDSMAPPMSANPAAMMAGKWEGTWQSDSTDYNGHMQGIIVFTGTTVKDKQVEQQYAASFKMRLFEVGFTDYTVTLNATKLADGRIHFEGVKDLGYYVGGIYRYDGYIYPDKDEFYCDYNSDKDCGTFKMRRITQDKQ